VRQTAFERSLDPMLVVDDARRVLDANVASCLFLRASREDVLRYRIDDLLAPEWRSGFATRWSGLLSGDGPSQLPEPPAELALPDGSRVRVSLSVATYNPGRHLVIVDFAPLRALIEEVQNARPAGGGVLTKREREVLTLVAEGKTGLGIAAELFLSPTTVQTHVNNSLLKLQARNRAHGIAIALQSGEIELGDAPLDPSTASISPISS
jgi:DNA-binding CsgD family transcriptional regulator